MASSRDPGENRCGGANSWPLKPSKFWLTTASLQNSWNIKTTHSYIHVHSHTYMCHFFCSKCVCSWHGFSSSLQRRAFCSRKGMPFPVPKQKVYRAKSGEVELKECLLWRQPDFLFSSCPLFADPGRCCPLQVSEFPLGGSFPKGANMNTGCVISRAGQNEEWPYLPMQTY